VGELELDPLEDVLADVRAGKPVVIFDDKDRENEGDLMIAAELVTPESIRFMVEHGRGLICLSLPKERFDALGIPPQTSDNTTPFHTNFTVSIDHRSVSGAGASAQSRAFTINRAVADDARADEFVQPGYVFPLASVSGGVLRRSGQTEGSVDLARLAGLKPGGVICEIMDDDGLMPSGHELAEYCKRLGLKITDVPSIRSLKAAREVSLRRSAETRTTDLRGLGIQGVSLEHFDPGLRIIVYADDADDKEHVALVVGEPKDDALVRIHSECLTGDVFGSLRCDCGDQFIRAFASILKAKAGVIIYLRQEGRGIGLGNKIRAYNLQDRGMDTIAANLELGFQADQRDYRVAAHILSDIGLHSVRLLTSNPEKERALKELGIEVSQRVPIAVPVNPHNQAYLATKKEKMGHQVVQQPVHGDAN